MLTSIATGAAWMVLLRVADRTLGVVSMLVLVRLLTPEDFGVNALASSVIALVELVSAFGFELALIQRHQPTRAHYDGAWTLNVLLGLGCAAILTALAYPTALFFNEPKLTLVILALALASLVQGAENIGVVDFRRNLHFSREFHFLGVKRLIVFVTTLTLAFLLRNYWALVAGVVVGRVVGVFISYRVSSYRPRFSLEARGDLLSFSKWLPINNALSFVHMRVPQFFVARVLGTGPLGIYAVASELAYLPSNDLVGPINRAVLPGLARMGSDPITMRRGFLDIASWIAALALPASIGLAAVADPVVRVALGAKWHEAIPIIHILAFSAGISAIASHNSSAFLALGRTGVPVLIGLLRVGVLVPFIVVLPMRFGLNGVAYAELAAMIATYVAGCAFMFHILRISLASYLAEIWRPLVSSAVMGYVVSYALTLEVLAAAAPIVQLIAAIPLGALAYGLVLFGLWAISGRPHGVERVVIARVFATLMRASHQLRGRV